LLLFGTENIVKSAFFKTNFFVRSLLFCFFLQYLLVVQIFVNKKSCIFIAPQKINSNHCMPIKQIDYGTKEYDQMLKLRYEILRKPLKLTFHKEDLEKEKDDILIGAFEEDKMLACCLLTKVDKECVRLRQMAVQNNVQGKGIGASLMNFAEHVARDAGYKKIIMHARKTAIGFYEKLGYSVTGDEFTEVSIPHFMMEKKLSF
jgi:predicted GNAT family N-acyltransferase